MTKALIVVDNLTIGGIQRLALDQAYGLHDLGIKTSMYLLNGTPLPNAPSFLGSEAKLITDSEIDLLGARVGRIQHIKVLAAIISAEGPFRLIICHSLKGTVLLFFAQLLLKSKLRVLTTIHQLPTLSAPLQRFRRFVYAQFTWKLFAYSTAVKMDWEMRVSQSIIARLFLRRKKIDFLRNGIYLSRLPLRDSIVKTDLRPRLIYLGRNTSWKGVSTFLEISNSDFLQDFEILFMVPRKSDLDFSSFDDAFLERVTVVEGRSIESFTPRAGDVHIYPANYGSGSRFVESVSLNCLELACLGVPSLLTANGLGSWPDLQESNIFHETNWSDLDAVARSIREISEIKFSEKEIQFFQSKISISNQLNSLLEIQ
jgi:glycosyltransferase involved in cell wall biosynthesis